MKCSEAWEEWEICENYKNAENPDDQIRYILPQLTCKTKKQIVNILYRRGMLTEEEKESYLQMNEKELKETNLDRVEKLYCRKGLTIRATAEQMGVSRGTVAYLVGLLKAQGRAERRREYHRNYD